MRGRIAISLLVMLAAVSVLAAAPGAHAAAPYDGWGFGISDPDPQPARSIDHRFAALQPKTFRFIVDWNIAANPGLKQQALTRIQMARAAGVREVAVSFSTPADPVDPVTWARTVLPFVDEFSPYVDWWSPVNEPTYRPRKGTNWLLERPEVAAQYSNQLAWHLAVFHPEDRLLSPDFNDAYDDDLADGTPLRTVTRAGQTISTTRDYVLRYAFAGGRFGERVAWHAHAGVRRTSALSTDDLTGALSAIGLGELPVWITEAGAFSGPRQEERVRFLVDTLSQRPAVTRVSYWHMFDHNDAWDTALVARDRSLRPAWFTWCAASHGRDSSHPDCAVPPVTERVATVAGDGSVMIGERPPGGPWPTAPGAELAAREVELQGDRLAVIRDDGSVWVRPGPGDWFPVADASAGARDIELNDRDRMAIAMGDGTVLLTKGLPPEESIPIGEASLNPRDIELDGDRLALIAGDGAVWLRDGLVAGAWRRVGGPVLNATDVEVEGGRIAIAAGDGSVWSWSGRWQSLGGPGGVRDIELDAGRLAVIDGDGRPWVEDGPRPGRWSAAAGAGFAASRIALSGDRMAAIRDDGSVWLEAGAGWRRVEGAGTGASELALF